MANRKAGFTLFLQLKDEIEISVTPDKISLGGMEHKKREMDLIHETCYIHGVYVLEDVRSYNLIKQTGVFVNLTELIWA